VSGFELSDRALPAGFEPASGPASPEPRAMSRLAERLLARGPAALAGLAPGRLLDLWSEAVERLRDRGSPERAALDPAMSRSCGLSIEGLRAGLETVLRGVRRDAARRLLAEPAAGAPSAKHGSLTLVVLAANLPGLAAQPLLRGLARGDAVLLKSPRAEPHFAPTLVRVLTALEPAFGECVAAVTWRGGDRRIEEPLAARAGRIEVFGDAETIASWRALASGTLTTYGPRASIGLVARGADLGAAARGLARDIALFDQHGCLSPQAIFVEGDAAPLAERLALELARLAGELPAGPPRPEQASAVQQLRGEAAMRGLLAPALPLEAGTVVVEPRVELRPSPGLRTVRIHPLASLDALPAALLSWHGRIQGAAFAGELPAACLEALLRSGVTRIAPAGELQHPEADWDGADQAPGISA
jgi:hypothetical protein